VRYEAVYPGVDLVFYGNPRQFEHDFIVAPGADPSRIQFRLQGADTLEITPEGDLAVSVGEGALHLKRPVVYQEDESGRRIPVEAGYALHADPGGSAGLPAIGFVVAAYDATRPLVIDPVLVSSTFLGGSDWDEGAAVAVDPDGSVYVAGYTSSLDFPTSAGVIDTVGDFDYGEAFVVKLTPGGTGILYATYLGGSSSDVALALAVDAAGNAHVAGYTDSIDFPTTPGAYQTTHDPGVDLFVAKLNPTGTALIFSTYLGGEMDEYPWAIAVDAEGSVYVAGEAAVGLPTTLAAYSPTNHGGTDAFVSKLNASGTTLLFSTFLGGSGYDAALGLALTPEGQVVVAGQTESEDFPTTGAGFSRAYHGWGDGFLSALSAEGETLTFSTYLGGSGEDVITGLAVDTLGYLYVVGTTESTDFPVTAGAFSTVHGGSGEVFVSKIHPGGGSLIYSTFLGGGDYDWGAALAVDAAGHAWVTGSTLSSDFPTTAGAFARSLSGGSIDGDAFVTVLNTAGNGLISSTFLGGAGDDAGFAIAVASTGQAYLTGYTDSPNFPVTEDGLYRTYGGGDSDAFLAAVTATGPTASLQVTKTGPGIGSVTSAPTGIDCGSTCSFEFDAGLTVILTATAEPGSTFSGWGGACSGTETCSLTMSEARSVTATFALTPVDYPLSIVKAGSAEGVVSSAPAGLNCGATCTAGFTGGSVVTLSASPAAGAVFREWRGACAGSSPTCILSMNAATSVTAVFAKVFTDDPLVVRSTPSKAVHITELRTAIDTLRARRNLAPFAYADGGLSPRATAIRVVHLTDLRTALTQAYQAAGRGTPTFGETLTARQTLIKASQLSELRTLVRGLE
jgi:hypothetical protein